MKTFVQKISLLIVSLALLTSVSIHAQINLAPLFSDNMVLQQKSETPIWGNTLPKKTVTVSTSWDKKKYKSVSDDAGKWSVSVETPAAGGPYEIEITSGKSITLKNVMIGEVWICSGQSNMEMPLAGWGQIIDYEEEIKNADHPHIRLLQVKKATSNRELHEFEADGNGWLECSPASIPDFSATAYFFGRELQKEMNIPIGLIHTSWGGTPAESWVSAGTLSNMPEFRERIEEFMNVPFNRNEELKAYQHKVEEWNKKLESLDFGIQNGIAVAAAINHDDSNWNIATLPEVWEKKHLPGFDGVVWYRKSIEIPKSWRGKDLTISLGTIDDNDVTYFNGIKAGETIGHNIGRKYTISKKLTQQESVLISVRVLDTGGDGGFYGDPKSMYIHPVNDETRKTYISGEWKFKKSTDLKDVGAYPQLLTDNPHNPTTLFNAMISPLLPYTIKGVIWYQGESNAGRAYQYRTLFPLMIEDWRQRWDNQFPFYFVQLANFMQQQEEPAESAWAELREAQLQTLNLQNTGMAVTIDIGDTDDIHPKNKQDVGKRLAFQALKKTYGLDITASGPIYKSYNIENGKIRISFGDNSSKLTVKGNKLTGFSIAGPDKKFYWANAVIEGNEIVVSSPEVMFPVAVRYAWADNPVCNLFNNAGLPASPFRTDDWPGTTINNF